MRKITGSVRPFFHVSASGTGQTRLNWDISGDPIGFYSTWWVRKKLSRFSNMIIDIKVQGNKSKTENKGDFTMQLDARINTSFEGWSIMLKPVWIIYSYLLYNRSRRAFLEQCKDYVYSFRNEIKEHFNLKITTMPAKSALG
jgi:hypothetical protein